MESLGQFARIAKASRDGSGGCGERAHQMRSRTWALAAFIGPVARACAALLRADDVPVHPQAHGAA